MQVVLASGRPHLCDSLCLFFSTSEVEVVGTVDSVASLLALVPRIQPDMVLLDTELAGPWLSLVMDTLEAGGAEPAIVLLTRPDRAAPPEIDRAEAHTAMGDPPDALLALILEINRKRTDRLL